VHVEMAVEKLEEEQAFQAVLGLANFEEVLLRD
jgi:hypothetical protein